MTTQLSTSVTLDLEAGAPWRTLSPHKVSTASEQTHCVDASVESSLKNVQDLTTAGTPCQGTSPVSGAGVENSNVSKTISYQKSLLGINALSNPRIAQFPTHDCAGQELISFRGMNLYNACAHGKMPECFMLMFQTKQAGQDPLLPDVQDNSLLHYATLAPEPAALEITGYLLQWGLDISSANIYGETAGHWAASHGKLELLHLLRSRGLDLDARDLKGCNTLIFASRMGHLYTVSYLTCAGASLEAIDHDGHNALAWAAKNGYTSVCAYLCARGQMTPASNGDEGLASREHSDMASRTPLHIAAAKGNKELCDLFLCVGFSPTSTTTDGHTPIDLARRNKHHHVVKHLERTQLRRNAEMNSHLKRKLSPDAYGYVSAQARIPNSPKGSGSLESAPSQVKLRDSLTSAFRRCGPQTNRLLAFAFFLVFPVLFFSSHVLPVYAHLPGLIVVICLLIALQKRVGKSGELSVAWTCAYPACSLPAFLWMHVITGGALWFSMHSLAFYSFYLVSILALIRLLCSNPGRIKPRSDEFEKLDAVCTNGIRPTDSQFCRTCYVERPLRSKHCSICDMCVARMDHHCTWLNKCVGFDNHRTFVAFIAASWVSMAAYTSGFAHFVAFQARANDASVFETLRVIARDHLPLIWVLGVVPSGMLVMTVILKDQIYGIVSNLTMNEMINKHRYEHFLSAPATNSTATSSRTCKNRRGGIRNPFSKGAKENSREFFMLNVDYKQLYSL